MTLPDFVGNVIASLGGSALLAAILVKSLGNVIKEGIAEQWKHSHDKALETLRSDLEGKVRTLQTELDRTVFVHRSQFDVEFAALRDIWARVAAARATMGLVRPTMDIVPADETTPQREARQFERLRVFNDDLNALVQAIDTQSPFIPRDVYQRLEGLIEIGRGEVTEVTVERQDQDPMRDWFRRGREHFQQFRQGAAEVSDLIRARLATLVVIREGRDR